MRRPQWITVFSKFDGEVTKHKNSAELRDPTNVYATDPIETQWTGKFEIHCHHFLVEEQNKCRDDLDCDVSSRFQRCILKDAITHFSKF